MHDRGSMTPAAVRATRVLAWLLLHSAAVVVGQPFLGAAALLVTPLSALAVAWRLGGREAVLVSLAILPLNALLTGLLIGLDVASALYLLLATLLSVALTGSIGHLREEVRRTRGRLATLAERHRELETSLTRFRAASDGSLDAFFLLDAERDQQNRIVTFVFAHLNRRAEALLGRPREEILGQPIDTVMPDVREEGLLDRLMRVAETGEAWEEEREARSPSLRADWLRQQVIAAGDGIAIFSQDISAAKSAEHALLESEREMRKLAMVASRTDNAVILCNTNGAVEWVNEGFTRMSEFSFGEVVQRKPESFLYGPQTNPETVAQMRRCLEQGVGSQVEMVHYAKSGRPYWVSMEVQPIRDQRGNITNYVTIGRDVTERQLAEEALRQSQEMLKSNEERLRLALVSSGQGLWDWDTTTGAVYFDEQWSRILGYRPDQLSPHINTWKKLIHPEDVPEVLRQLRAALSPQAEGLYEATYRARTASGEWLWNQARGQVVARNQNGRATRILGTIMDMTSRMRSEEELRYAKNVAEAANRAKGDFLATMSHEIRTPMNGIIGMVNLLLDTPLGPEQKENAETIKTSADELLNLINEILDFSKIEAGKLTIEPIPFDLQVAFEEVIELLTPRADESGLELLLRYKPGTPTRFIGDPGRIRQILVNLAGNAIKFTEEGHVIVRVSSADRTSEKALLLVEVQDSGIGVPEQNIDLLFEKFSQADTSTTRQYGGTGLGLAICKRLTRAMGGEIGVRSREGRGSTFWFTLPLPLDTSPPEEPLHPADLEGLRILVVDNNQVNCRILKEQVESWGMRPEVVVDGAAALHLMRRAEGEQDPFAMALIDAFMPGMDGEELARKIHDDPRCAESRLVLLSSRAQRGDAKRAERAGFSAYLVKPVRASTLRETLGAVWSQRNAADKKPRMITRHLLAEFKTAQRKATPRKSTLGKYRVLLAEDNVVNQKVATKMLERMGCRVDVAANGREAVEMFESLPYDIVFMDCQMPEMDGYEATAAIRQLHASEIPIVALTANAMEGDRERCLEAGMDDYLSKPLKASELEDAIERWSGAPAGPAESAQPSEL